MLVHSGNECSAGADQAGDTRGVANDECMRWHIARDDAAHANHAELAERHAGSNRAVRADGRTATDNRRQRRFIRITRAQLANVRIRRARRDVVGEYGVCSNHDAIVKRDAGAQIHARVDLAQVANDHVVGDVAFFADDAVAADTGSVPNVNAIPDTGAVTDANVRFDDGGGVDLHGVIHCLLALLAGKSLSRTARPEC